MEIREMLCPYCWGVFEVSEKQIMNNLRFKCPFCKKYNEGSETANGNGVLIGVSLEEFKRFKGE